MLSQLSEIIKISHIEFIMEDSEMYTQPHTAKKNMMIYWPSTVANAANANNSIDKYPSSNQKYSLLKISSLTLPSQLPPKTMNNLSHNKKSKRSFNNTRNSTVNLIRWNSKHLSSTILFFKPLEKNSKKQNKPTHLSFPKITLLKFSNFSMTYQFSNSKVSLK